MRPPDIGEHRRPRADSPGALLRHATRPVLALAVLCGVARPPAQAQSAEGVARGPFGLSMVATADGERAAAADFALSQDCAYCHPRQWFELRGSMHSVAHEDPLYRAFAELAREEAGDEIYAYCSGCHSPAGVVSGLIPRVHDPQLPPAAKAGITCDVCHQVSALTGIEGPWGEPANGSFVLDPGRQKFGIHGDATPNPAHTSVLREQLSSSEFCASCHTVIHPVNGLRIEHTYDEWKNSIYAEKGIQCQDCHMRSVEDATRVAEQLTPIEVIGTSAISGPERSISPHFFAGGNVDARGLAGGGRHAVMAKSRLQSAAELAVSAPASVAAGSAAELSVGVTNVGAGHDLPTSLTELREMWIHVRALDAAGLLVFESGALDDHGEIEPGAVRFGAGLVDAQGSATFKPWEAVDFAWKRTVPPKGTVEEVVEMSIPSSASGSLSIEARLLYRIAPPHVLEEVMGEQAFDPVIVEMARAETRIEVEP